MRSINPYTQQIIAEYAEQTPDQVRAVIERARIAFGTYRHFSFEQRATLLRAVGDRLRKNESELASLITREMGKPIVAAEAEIEKCASCCDHFAAHGQDYLAEQLLPSDARSSGVGFEPLGPILAIMPWNFPFWQVFRFAAPALMAGNVGLLKHAPNVTGCALAIEQLFADAGYPAGCFYTLRVDVPAITAIVEDPAIAAVTLTGSESAGKSVGELAGRALKKVVLELGGSDPFIVLPDADPVVAAKAAAAARCINAGQSCIAAKRFIVVGNDLRFERELVEAMSGIQVGDPADRATEMGPLARLDLLENLHEQVRRTLTAGAKLLTGGHRLDRTGYFYAPTVLADVRPGMAAFDEETFGPVAPIIHAENLDHAIALANATRFGLGASIWTADAETARREILPRIEAGCVFINGAVKSDPALPFGGIKHSGHGRELSALGIREFVNAKTWWSK